MFRKNGSGINPLVHARFAHEGPIVALSYSGDGKALVSVAEDRTVKQWETLGYTELTALERQPEIADAAVVSPVGDELALGRMDGSLALLSLRRSVKPPQITSANLIEAVLIEQSAVNAITEAEPNDRPDSAAQISIPATVSGTIHATRDDQLMDNDLFAFNAKAGEQWMIEINAARSKSPLDSKVEILTADGQPITRVLLQAVRDSYFTFRGKNSETIDDYRVHNWQEMELNEYLYANGEVVKLWLYPRGPDSGFKVYPGVGKRYTYFDTTAISHPLHETCYIVQPHPPGSAIIPNGLPIFPVYYENDDDSRRRWGSDSRLTFTAPADGKYLVRVADARGFHGENYKYTLTVRPRKPDFQVTLQGANPAVSPGSGKEFSVKAERLDDFEGPIRVDIEDVPPGFRVTTPIIIEAGQDIAFGSITALADAAAPTPENSKISKVNATATISGKGIIKTVNNLGEIKLAGKPQLDVEVVPVDADESVQFSQGEPLELTIAPGQTIVAKVRVQRNDHKGSISFGKEDSGRNLPHGVFVDNIGLNGLLIVEGKHERTFYITAAKWVPETTREFHLKTTVGKTHETSLPVILHVRKPSQVVER